MRHCIPTHSPECNEQVGHELNWANYFIFIEIVFCFPLRIVVVRYTILFCSWPASAAVECQEEDQVPTTVGAATSC